MEFLGKGDRYVKFNQFRQIVFQKVCISYVLCSVQTRWVSESPGVKQVGFTSNIYHFLDSDLGSYPSSLCLSLPTANIRLMYILKISLRVLNHSELKWKFLSYGWYAAFPKGSNLVLNKPSLQSLLATQILGHHPRDMTGVTLNVAPKVMLFNKPARRF